MSISKFQERFLGKGCGVAITIGMALVFLGLGFQRCSGGGQTSDQEDQQQAQTIVTVGGKKGVTLSDLSSIQSAMMQNSTQDLSYSTMVRIRAEALSRSIDTAAMLYIADENHIVIDDKAVVDAEAVSAQEQIQTAEQQLATSKKLKNPTPAQLSNLFQSQYHLSPTQAIGRISDNVQQKLNDPQNRPQTIAEAVPMIVEQAFVKKAAVSDDQLKANYDTYTVKRIFISAKSNANVDEAIGKVEADLKGGMSFENAMDKYSNDPRPPGKKVSDSSTTIPAQFIQFEPGYEVLKGQKAGFVSAPLSIPGGKAILKITQVSENLPKDFATNIAKYRTDAAKSQGDADLQKQLQQVIASPDTKWNIQGYKALYDVNKAILGGTMPPSPKALQALVDEAKAAQTGGGSGESAANDAYFLAADALYNSPGADKAKLADLRIDAIKAALQSNEDFDLRMELVDLYVKKKDGLDAIDQLTAAATANTSYDVLGQRHFGDLSAKRAELIKDGLAKEADFKNLDAAQTSWKKGKQDQDKEAAEMKVEEAKQKAEQAKLDAENAAAVKQQQEAAKSKAPATKFSTTPQTSATQARATGINPAPKPGAAAPGSSLLPQGSPLSKGK